MGRSRVQASILVVDDVPDNLEVLCSMLRSLGHEPRPVPNGHLALSAARSAPPDLVLLDVMMPGMDGYAVLHVLKSDRSLKHIPVIMVSALDEQEGALRCIEAGADDYLTKPVSEMLLRARVSAGLERKRWYDSERELLERTLAGSVALLTGLLARANPIAFERAKRVHEMALLLAGQMGLESTWEVDLAGMFCQLGCIDVPATILEKAYAGEPLTPEEQARYDAHPQLAAELLSTIPRLEGVAHCVRYAHKNYDGSGPPDDDLAGDALPVGARILALTLDYDQLLVSGHDSGEALGRLAEQAGWYDPAVLRALSAALEAEGAVLRAVRLADLQEGMELVHDIVSLTGEVLVPRGRVVTALLRDRLARGEIGAREPVMVRSAAPTD